VSTEPSGFVGRNEGIGTGTGEGEREYTTLFCPSVFSVGTEASSISTSSSRCVDSSSDDESDSDEDEESSETTGLAGTCVLSFTVVGLASSEPDELSSEEEDEDSDEEATRLFLFLFRFRTVFAAATVFTALL
jgi:hypothetical protein